MHFVSLTYFYVFELYSMYKTISWVFIIVAIELYIKSCGLKCVPVPVT